MNLAILSRTRRACELVFARGKIFAESLQKKYAMPMLGGLIAVFILISYSHPVQASGMFGALTDITGLGAGLVVGLIKGLLYIVVTLLMVFNSALATMMIKFAQYNNFVYAQPVLMGWPLVRDVCNMFFILVLLVVAFSTIIGYEPFNYKKVVPKLLLMSVLINFSKTLVGVLIDFSQVLTLTFVNGFRAAAFGNFMSAFGLMDMMTFIRDAKQDDSEVIIAVLFAIGLLSVLATILLIMCIYFLVRIIMLWILLIFSPMAFFALALPEKLAKSLSMFTSDWWKRLSSLLSGGPIVAFFLWLTFAMIQNGGSNFAASEKIYTPGTAAEESSLGITITPMGKPENLTTFMVAAIMLLLGLNTAVSISKEAAPQLGQLAEKIKSTGGPVGWAGKLGYKAGKGTARAADRRLGISTGVGRTINQASTALGTSSMAKLPVVGGLVGLAATKMSRGGDKIRGIGAADRAEMKKGAQAEVADESIEIGNQKLERMKTSGNALEREIAEEMLIERQLGEGKNQREKELTDGFRKDYLALGMSPADAEARAKADAAHQKMKEDAINTSRLKGIYEARGDSDALAKLNEKIEKSGGLLNESLEKLGNEVGKTDLSTLKNTNDSAVAAALLKRIGKVDAKGKIAVDWENADALKSMREKGGATWDNLKATVHQFQMNANGEKMMEYHLNAMKPGVEKGTAAWNAAEKARFTTTAKGDSYVYGFQPGSSYGSELRTTSKAGVEGGYMDMKSMNDVTSRLEKTTSTPSERAAAAAVRTELANPGNPISFTKEDFSVPFDEPMARTFVDAVQTARTSTSGGVAPDMAKLKAAQIGGFSSEVASMYEKGTASKAYTSPLASSTHAAIMQGAMDNLGEVVTDPATGETSYMPKKGAAGLEARNVVGGIDMDAFKEDGQYTENVVRALHGNEEKFIAGYVGAGAKEKAKMKKMVKELANISSKKKAGAKNAAQEDVLAALRATKDKEVRKEMGLG